MQTPEFNKIAFREQADKNFARRILTTIVLDISTVALGTVLMATGRTSWWAFVLCGCSLAIGSAEADVRRDVYKVQKKAQQAFVYQIVNAHLTNSNVESFETAKLMAEYVLRFMTEDEKNKILSVYKSTDFNNEHSVSSFAQNINKIVKDVLYRRPNLTEILKDIAAGQTYMFNGCCDNLGHGSR